ncbi:MAG TPA: methyltransferase domain-containing protein [Burkholderiales bacterium]|nr:methyltransferase domain-containing protein [Burkholderiales bacterium]
MKHCPAIPGAVRLAPFRPFLIACALLIGWSGAMRAQEKDLDTPYVQTPQNVVDRMLEIARIGPDDYVIDLGSGDGRMVITAASRYGARGFGVDLDGRLVELSNRNAARAGVAKRVTFYQRDLFETDVSAATVLTLYLLPDVNLAIRSRLLATLKPGTRIVSHDYDFGDWPPDLQLEMPAPGKKVGIGQRSKVFHWVVPGVAAGKWRWQLQRDGRAEDYELSLEQNFQKLSGKLVVGGHPAKLENPVLTGEQITFTANVGEGAGATRYEFTGRIYNHAISGTARANPGESKGGAGQEQAWNATRTQIWDPRHLAHDAGEQIR